MDKSSEGTYTCAATNSEESRKQIVYLKVKRKLKALLGMLKNCAQSFHGTINCISEIWDSFLYTVVPPKALSVRLDSIHQPDICVNVSWKLNEEGRDGTEHVWLTFINMKQIHSTNVIQQQVPVSLNPNKVGVHVYFGGSRI